MRSVAVVLFLAAMLLVAADYSPGIHHDFWTFVATDCVTKATITTVDASGATLGTVTNAGFTAGSACAVIPPVGTPVNIALRCVVGAGSADIIASAPVEASAPAGDWCVEVRTVAPAFAQ